MFHSFLYFIIKRKIQISTQQQLNTHRQHSNKDSLPKMEKRWSGEISEGCRISVAIKCDHEFIYESNLEKKLVKIGQYSLFHDNGMIEIITPEDLQANYLPVISSTPNIRIYTKYFPLNSLVTEASLKQQGDQNDNETIGNQKSFTQTMTSLVTKLTSPSQSTDQEEEQEVEGLRELEQQKDSLHGIDLRHSEDALFFTWNQKNFTFFSFRITTDFLSIRFHDLPHTKISGPSRFTGNCGDYLVLNSQGYFFGIFSPTEFNRSFVVGPLIPLSPSSSTTSPSSLALIQKFKYENLRAIRLQTPTPTFWNGKIEFDEVGDYLVQMSLTSEPSSPANSRTQQLSPGATCPPNDVYQCLISEEVLGELVEISPRIMLSPETILTEPSWYHDPINVSPFTDPFSLFTKNIPCYQGRLLRQLKTKKWKDTQLEIYPDRICLLNYKESYFSFLDVTSIEVETMEIQKDTFRAVVKMCGAARVNVKETEQSTLDLFTRNVRRFSFGSLSSPLPANADGGDGDGGDGEHSAEYFTIVECRTSENEKDVIEDLRQLFYRCWLWSRRSLMVNYCHDHSTTSSSASPSEGDPHNKELDMILEYLTELTSDDRDLILTSPLNEPKGQETLVHLAIQSNNLPLVMYIINKTQGTLVLSTSPFMTQLNENSYLCWITQPEMFHLLYPHLPPQLFSDRDSDGNTLLMLLLLRHSTTAAVSSSLNTVIPSSSASALSTYSMIKYLLTLDSTSTSSLPTQDSLTFSTEYLNHQNVEKENLLFLTLRSFHQHSHARPLPRELLMELTEIIELILSHGGDRLARDQENNTCLHILCSYLTQISTNEEYLLNLYRHLFTTLIGDMGASVLTALNDHNETPLSRFAQSPPFAPTLLIPKIFIVDILNLLIGYRIPTGGGVVDAQSLMILNHSFPGTTTLSSSSSSYGHPPLHRAAYTGNVPLVAYFLEHGVQINQKNRLNETALDILDHRLQSLDTLPKTLANSTLQDNLAHCSILLVNKRATTSRRRFRPNTAPDGGGLSMEVVFRTDAEGTIEVSSGTITGLVHHYSLQEPVNQMATRALVHGYHHLCPHHEMLGIIKKELEAQLDTFKSNEVLVQSEDSQTEVSLFQPKSLISILSLWSKNRRFEIGTSVTLLLLISPVCSL
jgi:ankyrin repeat protein